MAHPSENLIREIFAASGRGDIVVANNEHAVALFTSSLRVRKPTAWRWSPCRP